MESAVGKDTKNVTSFRHEPDYLSLSRMLLRYQNLILLTPTSDESLDARLAPWQKTIQSELWSPLPFHRMKWLHSIEGARTLLLKLEQSSQNIKVQRTKREVVKDLAQKRMIIKRLRVRVEEIGREVESSNQTTYEPQSGKIDDSESMYDVLQDIRKHKQSHTANESHSEAALGKENHHFDSGDAEENMSKEKNTLFESASHVRRRQGNSTDDRTSSQGKTSGFSNLPATENLLLAASKEHEDITTSLVSMAAQLKQQARQFQFTLDQDKGMIDRALEGLDKNVSAMGLASKGMKTLQRMSEEQGWWGRIKLQLIIAGMWAVAILLVFAGPKLRF